MTTIEELAAEIVRVDEKINEVLNLNLSEFVSTYQLDQLHYIDQTELENRIAALDVPQLPGGLITESELEARLAQLNIPTIPSNLATTTYVENRISAIPTQQDFTALTQTLTAALNQVAANVESKATQQDVSLAATAVDAKFDMLRAAINESVDFDTLKARLLAVLQ